MTTDNVNKKKLLRALFKNKSQDRKYPTGADGAGF